MFHIATDSATDMPDEWREKYQIHVIPVNIHFGERTFLQGVDLDNEGFYRLVDESGTIPKTSQPSPHQFKEFYESFAQAGESILSIHVTSKLSGTFNSAVAAARELAGKIQVIPFDSMAGSAAVGWMCREASLLREKGLPLDEIIRRLEESRRKVQVILALDTLEYARLSGRVSQLQAALGSLLKLKPIIALKDGILETVDKVRTRSTSLERILQMAQAAFGQQPVHLSVVHSRDPETAANMLERARTLLNVIEANITDLSISVAANLGPGTIGLVLYPARQEEI